jgi:hypothetical protein
MEFLGHCSTKIKRNNKNGKWEPINLVYTDVESYCEATSRLINGFNDECRFVVVDKDGERHFVYTLDYRYKTADNTIILFPEKCKKIKSR